jgi:response regulator NasT
MTARDISRANGVVSPRLRIVLAEDEADTRESLAELLRRLGHEVIAVADGRQLVELCQAAVPDLAVSDIKMPGTDGIRAALEVNCQHPVPVVLVSAYHDPELYALAGGMHVMAYLVKPIKPEDLEAAVALAVPRFAQMMALATEAAEARQALEDRKVIERAKGAVARRLQVCEEDAFHRMRKKASGANRTLVEVAREVLAAEEVFCAFGPAMQESRRKELTQQISQDAAGGRLHRLVH